MNRRTKSRCENSKGVPRVPLECRRRADTMKRIAHLPLTLLIVTLLLVPLHANCENSSESIEKGKTIHLKLLARHKKIDNFYRGPFLWGELTEKPLCCISVPASDWESLDEGKKELLARYAESLIGRIKADPFRYAKVNRNAPMASAVRRNVAAMSKDSWGIVVGPVSPDGRDIGTDRIARSGK
jgi:hypothetical protein